MMECYKTYDNTLNLQNYVCHSRGNDYNADAEVLFYFPR
jgi:hypothetical protein